jgi:hypothetical protein
MTSVDPGLRLETYDNTKLKTARECPLQYYYRHEQGYVYAGEYLIPALAYGNHIHKGLDLMYEAKNMGDVTRWWVETYPEIEQQYDPNDPSKEKCTLQIGGDMLKGYWDYWQESIQAMDLLAYEQFFAMDIGLDEERECPACNGEGGEKEDVEMFGNGPKVINIVVRPCLYCAGTGTCRGPWYCGRVDKIFNDQRTGQIVGMDHKTTSFLSGAVIDSFKISQQFRGYAYWLRRQSPWSQDAGDYFYFDLLLKSKTKYNEDNVPFYRDSTLIQPSFLDEWWKDMVAHIHEIRDMRARANSLASLPRQNSDACNNWGRICTYYDLCSMPTEMRDSIGVDLYDVHWWNPLEPD